MSGGVSVELLCVESRAAVSGGLYKVLNSKATTAVSTSVDRTTAYTESTEINCSGYTMFPTWRDDRRPSTGCSAKLRCSSQGQRSAQSTANTVGGASACALRVLAWLVTALVVRSVERVEHGASLRSVVEARVILEGLFSRQNANVVEEERGRRRRQAS